MKKTFVIISLLLTSVPFFAQETLTADNRSFFASVTDFVTTAPYFLNIGCEPTVNNGAKTFGSLEYKWTPALSSQIYFEKGSDFAFEESYSDSMGDRTFTTETGDYFCKVFPYKKYFNKAAEDSFKFSVSLGLAGEMVNARINSNEIISNDVYGEPGIGSEYFANYKSTSEQTNLLLGPCIDFEFSLPLTSWLSFNAENSIVPVYFYNINLTHNYEYVNYYTNPQQKFSDYAFGTGIARLKCHLDFVKKVGLVVNYEYSRLPDYNMGFDGAGVLYADRYMKTSNTLRFGGALLQTTDTFVRIQTGFYREYLWTTSTASQETLFTKSWVLSVSVGF